MLCLVFAALVLAGPPASHADDWPHWRGPDRNDIVVEDSLYDAGGWPPRETWQRNVGEGASSPLVIGDALYVMGSQGGRDTLFCLDAASGRQQWQVSYASPRYGRNATGDQGLYAGITSTPEYDPATSLLYTLGTDGDLNCWDTNDRGRRVWGINLYDDYRMEQREKIGRSGRRDYGYTTAPLVYQDWLLVEVGGNRGTVMAFDKRTGRAVWGSECRDAAGHTGGLVPMTVDGVPCAAVMTLHHLLVVRLDPPQPGKTVALHPWTTEFANNIASPAAAGNEVLITSGYNQAAMCKLRITLRGAQQVWQRPEHSKICTPVIHDGRVYWVSQQPYCLDFATGKLVWTGPRVFGDAGSCILTSDQRLIVWAKRGDLVLAETAGRSGGAFKQLVRIDGLTRDDAWPHVVLANGRLYVKDRSGDLKCLQIGQRTGGGGATDPDLVRRDGGGSHVAPTPAVDSPAPKIDLADLTSWPGQAPGLVVAWRRGLAPDKLVSTVDKASGSWRLVPRDNARVTSTGVVEIVKGAMLVQGTDEALLRACRRTNELTIETRLATADNNQAGPARIVSFSTDPYQRNFTLGQERDQLVLRLRTPRTGENGMPPETRLGPVKPREPIHVLVTYRDGELICYLNGQPAVRSSAVRGDFSNWTSQHLLLGDEWQQARHWQGWIERVAIYCRFMGPEEARRRYELSGGRP